MHHDLVSRVRRKLQLLAGQLVAARQPNVLADVGKTIVTTFHDVEGDYAVPGQHRACIETVARILDIEKRHGIHSTYNVVAKFALDAPNMLMAIRNDDHEIASHSYDHKVLLDLSLDQVADNISSARAVFAKLGVHVVGHRSPQSAWNRGVMRLLLREGFRWTAENGRESHPYAILGNDAAVLWRFPVTDDDWCYMRDQLHPSEALSRWQSVVRRAREIRRYTAIGFHPWVEAVGDRLAVFDEFLHWLSEQSDVQVLPFGKVLELILAYKRLHSSS